MSKKISNLYIHSFRGIPNELKLSFCDKNNHPLSTIIHGDNGSGKSSIIDAIEYNLQGRLGRSESMNNSTRQSPISYSNSMAIGCDTKVTFEDNSENQRGIRVQYDDNGYRIVPESSKPISDFKYVPVVLRRTDIIKYGQVESASRQIMFLNFFYSLKTKDKNGNDIIQYTEDDPKIIAIKEELIKVKQKRRDFISEFADLISVDETQIQANKAIDGVFNRYVTYQGNKFPKNKEGNMRIILPKQIYYEWRERINSFMDDCDKVAQLNQMKRELLKPSNNLKFKICQMLLSEASDFLSDSFRSISNAQYVQSIKLIMGVKSPASFDIMVELVNGKQMIPTSIFSEANYDLMILLLYISLVRAAALRGQSKLLVLDDVLQSVDATIRVKFIDYLLDKMSDWQFIITTHDRLWLNQLKYQFQRHGHQYKEYNIERWTFKEGPFLLEQNNYLVDDTLICAIKTNNNTLIASASGVLLEKICQQLSITLHISIHRTYGDKYTIGDLWPGIKKVLKKTSLNELISSIDSLLSIRNMLGCHYNEWALALSDNEIISFANYVQELYDKVFCKECMSWISILPLTQSISCKCETIKL